MRQHAWATCVRRGDIVGAMMRSLLMRFWDDVVLFMSSCMVCIFFVPLSFSPLVSSLDSTLCLRSFIEACTASGNGPDLVCAHCSSMVSNFASGSSMVQFARAAFVADVGVKASVAVLDGALAVDGCGMAVVCLANKCFSHLRAFFAAFFEISAIVEIRGKRERDDASTDTKTGHKMTKNGSTQDCVSQITLSSPRWDGGRCLESVSQSSRVTLSHWSTTNMQTTY